MEEGQVNHLGQLLEVANGEIERRIAERRQGARPGAGRRVTQQVVKYERRLSHHEAPLRIRQEEGEW
jgi:hypothetical protein